MGFEKSLVLIIYAAVIVVIVRSLPEIFIVLRDLFRGNNNRLKDKLLSISNERDQAHHLWNLACSDIGELVDVIGGLRLKVKEFLWECAEVDSNKKYETWQITKGSMKELREAFEESIDSRLKFIGIDINGNSLPGGHKIPVLENIIRLLYSNAIVDNNVFSEEEKEMMDQIMRSKPNV